MGNNVESIATPDLDVIKTNLVAIVKVARRSIRALLKKEGKAHSIENVFCHEALFHELKKGLKLENLSLKMIIRIREKPMKLLVQMTDERSGKTIFVRLSFSEDFCQVLETIVIG